MFPGRNDMLGPSATGRPLVDCEDAFFLSRVKAYDMWIAAICDRDFHIFGVEPAEGHRHCFVNKIEIAQNILLEHINNSARLE